MGFSIFCILESFILLANAVCILNGIHEPMSDGKSYISAKNQIALLLYVIRRFGKWPLMACNAFFITFELLVG